MQPNQELFGGIMAHYDLDLSEWNLLFAQSSSDQKQHLLICVPPDGQYLILAMSPVTIWGFEEDNI